MMEDKIIEILDAALGRRLERIAVAIEAIRETQLRVLDSFDKRLSEAVTEQPVNPQPAAPEKKTRAKKEKPSVAEPVAETPVAPVATPEPVVEPPLVPLIPAAECEDAVVVIRKALAALSEKKGREVARKTLANIGQAPTISQVDPSRQQALLDAIKEATDAE